jgi:hypothetical protein
MLILPHYKNKRGLSAHQSGDYMEAITQTALSTPKEDLRTQALLLLGRLNDELIDKTVTFSK